MSQLPEYKEHRNAIVTLGIDPCASELPRASLSTKFKQKISTWDQDKQPNTLQYCPETSDTCPFLKGPSGKGPSGSDWGRAHLDWLGIYHEWDCDLSRIFTKKSRLEETGAIVQFLRDKLDLTWSEVTERDHDSGSFYGRLRSLASWVEPTPRYQIPSVLPSSSPARSEQSAVSDISHGARGMSPSGKIFTYPASEISPSAFKSLPSSPPTKQTHCRSTRLSEQAFPTLSDPLQHLPSSSERSSPDRDSAYEPTSSPPVAHVEGIDGKHPGNRLEKDVEYAATAFLYIMINAFRSTEADISLSEIEAQDLKFDYS